jgi:DNA modification methylase
MLGRKFVGIEQNSEFLKISKARRILLNEKYDEWAKKIPDLSALS